MRLLILLCFLGSWSTTSSPLVLSSPPTSTDTSGINNNATKTSSPTATPGTTTAVANASSSSTSSRNTLMTDQSEISMTTTTPPHQTVINSLVPSTQSDQVATAEQNKANSSTSAGSRPTNSSDRISLLALPATSGVTINGTEPSSTTTQASMTPTVTKAGTSSSSSRKSTGASAASSPAPTNRPGTSAPSPNQGLSENTAPTSRPTSISATTPSAATESVVANAPTDRTKEGAGVETVTSAPGNVQNTSMNNEVGVKNTTGTTGANATSGASFAGGTGHSEKGTLGGSTVRNAAGVLPSAESTTLEPKGNNTISSTVTGKTEANATSGAFADGTGHSEKGTLLGFTVRNAAGVLPSAESMTVEPKGNNTISSTAYCVEESSNQNYVLPIKNMDCESFVREKGRAMADAICSGLVMAEGLKGFDKCEVQFSHEKEHQGKLHIDVSFKVSVHRMNDVLKRVQEAMKEDLNQNNDDENKQRESATELKKLIAMVVTGLLLLLVFLSAIVYWGSQRKSKLKDPYLTEELRTVDNGCHDNPAMDITERESEMEEKKNSKATYLENTDGWIVPMGAHIKGEVEEEDTHL
ncbi:podocalyxin isoform X2 [Rhinoraja longicauda]